EGVRSSLRSWIHEGDAVRALASRPDRTPAVPHTRDQHIRELFGWDPARHHTRQQHLSRPDREHAVRHQSVRYAQHAHPPANREPRDRPDEVRAEEAVTTITDI